LCIHRVHPPRKRHRCHCQRPRADDPHRVSHRLCCAAAGARTAAGSCAGAARTKERCDGRYRTSANSPDRLPRSLPVRAAPRRP
jgi:hypothetical protein